MSRVTEEDMELWIGTDKRGDYPKQFVLEVLCEIANGEYEPEQKFSIKNIFTHRFDEIKKLAMIENSYHFSSYLDDCDRSNYLKKNSILNPHSLHPTMKGHKMIADMLDKEISW